MVTAVLEVIRQLRLMSPSIIERCRVPNPVVALLSEPTVSNAQPDRSLLASNT